MIEIVRLIIYSFNAWSSSPNLLACWCVSLWRVCSSTLHPLTLLPHFHVRFMPNFSLLYRRSIWWAQLASTSMIFRTNSSHHLNIPQNWFYSYSFWKWARPESTCDRNLQLASGSWSLSHPMFLIDSDQVCWWRNCWLFSRDIWSLDIW